MAKRLLRLVPTIDAMLAILLFSTMMNIASSFLRNGQSILPYGCGSRRLNFYKYAPSTPKNAITLRSNHPSLDSNASTDDEQLTDTTLYGKTLVSVEECIKAYQRQKQQTNSDEHRLSTSQPQLKFIDASWYHRPDPKTNQLRNPVREFQIGPRIPKAHHLDIDAVATTFELFPAENPLNLPHMMPPPDLFGLAMDAYGISNEDHIIVYARRGAVFTPRTWFLFVCMGHDLNKVHLMQGSLEDWIERGGDVEASSLLINTDMERDVENGYGDCFHQGILNVTKLYSSQSNKISSRYQLGNIQARHICNKEEVLEAVNDHLTDKQKERSNSTKTIIVDTRGTGYTKKGHMPSAIHLPYRSLLNPLNPLQLLPKSELHTILTEKGINYKDPNLKIILSCGSGVSVCHGFLTLKLLGREISEENTRVYDGSWKEWGRMEEDLPRVLPNEV